MVDEAAIAAKKKKEMDDEIERVKQEFEEKQKKKKEKETSKKDDKEKDSKDKKDEGKEDKTTNEKVCNMSNHSQSNLIPTKLPLESLEEIECSCITRTKSNTRRGT